MTTLAVALNRAEQQLQAAGVDTPRLDAEILLARVLGVSRTSLLPRLREALSPTASELFASLLERRQRREPVAYIEGGREFWSRWFEVDCHTLVPRPETELLVELSLRCLQGVEAPRILEVGTGSGCVAVTLACECRDARLTAIDVSTRALAVARRNAERWDVADRIDLLATDVCSFACAGPFDLVVANPPYARRAEIDELMPEVSVWEPRSALDGGEDGLEVVRAVLRLAFRLAPSMAIEIGSDQATPALALARAVGFEDAAVANDLAGLPRVLWRRGLQPC
jgi:release factor glutamine methyltransferase